MKERKMSMTRVTLLATLFLALFGAVGCVHHSYLPMPQYSRVLAPPLAMQGRRVGIVFFDSKNAQVVAGSRTPAQVQELKDTSGTMIAETIALKTRARLNTMVDAMPLANVNGYDFIIQGKVIQVDPGDANLRIASGVTSHILGGFGGGGGGVVEVSGEVDRVDNGNLVRVADFAHKAQIHGGTFTSDGDVVRAGAEQVSTLVANFFLEPRDNNQVQ
jgi:hypothetical protein